jgi:hypothetical protein
MAVEPGDKAGAAHAMPLVAQAAGVEVQRVARAGRFGGDAVFGGDKAGATGRGGKTPSS